VWRLANPMEAAVMSGDKALKRLEPFVGEWSLEM
jgi:hypothetical protein